MILGSVIALLTAVAWAGSSIILKLLTAKIDSLSLNTIRLWVSSLLLILFIPLTGRWGALIDTPLLPFIYVIASGIIAMAVGDSIYIKSLSILDASIAFPIAQCSFPVMTVLAAVVLLEENFTWLTGLGAAMVVLGVYFIAGTGKGSNSGQKTKQVAWYGVVLALIAAFAWTVAAVILKIGVVGMDPFVAAGIRIPASAIFLSIVIFTRRKKGVLSFKEYGLRSIMLAAAAGILTYGFAAVGYVKAMQLIGAGKTVLLSVTAPLFVLPFSILFLRERPTKFTIAGIFLCVAGIWMVVL